MKNEFIPYEQALELKELGFDEPCFIKVWWLNSVHYQTKVPFKPHITMNGQDIKFEYPIPEKHPSSGFDALELQVPTFSQAFRWFREKHRLYYHILPEFYTKGINFNWQIFWYLPKEEWTDYIISDGTGLYGDNNEYPTQEYAEIACLNELIKIVKNKNE